ncbi:probable indole-3-pyruvate monooxygenase YUCCA10 [Mercurialis annua]|uniref:probable indole-3-pyruvate monooxygenase YUCCA10 n=1 Tax=Mercurialis annua TaxID=3986 RepID=UPI00215FC50D|nr:probable indole-3-pyruvate monooxygenase YUCCA10 [Mercurialis annua]
MEDKVAIIVGAGPSGLAASACLNLHSIPHIILDREDCFASLWQRYSYDRLHLHLKKRFSQLLHFPHPSSFPSYIPKDQFIQYLNDFISHFNISPLYNRLVESASFDQEIKKWTVKAKNVNSGEDEVYSARFLIVATGEACDPFVPDVEGLGSFNGEVFHSTKYKNGKAYRDKNVLVVGSGNSGMEIALDLANHGAKTSIVVRSPVHIIPREMASLGLAMLKYFSLRFVDSLLVLASKIVYGDMSKYGIIRATEGPFFSAFAYGKYPIINTGTFSKIKSGEIQVLPALESIRGNEAVFKNGSSHSFDTIIFCTAFKRSTSQWLKDDNLLNENGLSKVKYPNHWKGENGLYCVGLSRGGFNGASRDAQNAANDIKSLL